MKKIHWSWKSLTLHTIIPLQDLFCGVLNAADIGLVTCIQRILEYIFMPAISYSSSGGDDEDLASPMVRNQLLPSLRSFCSALKGKINYHPCERSYTIFNFFF